MRRVVLVTGAGRGIGAACAERFAADGHDVVLVSRGKAALKAAERRAAAAGGRTLALAGDVSEESFARRAFAAAERAFGPVDVLVNNAAVFEGGPLASYPAKKWDETMAVNLRGSFLFARELLRRRPRRGRRRAVVFVSSLAGVEGAEKFAGSGAYAASKAGLVALGAVLAVEGRALGVDSYVLAPGAVETDMLRRAAPGLRGAAPSEVAAAIALIASGRSGLRSGECLALDTNRRP